MCDFCPQRGNGALGGNSEEEKTRGGEKGGARRRSEVTRVQMLSSEEGVPGEFTLSVSEGGGGGGGRKTGVNAVSDGRSHTFPAFHAD